MAQGFNKAEFEKRFTKTSDAIKHIEQLRRIDLSSITDTELDQRINNYFNIIPFTSAIIPKGKQVFRARVNINNGESFNYLNEIYAPPSSCIKKYGRANKPGERVFYCSSNIKLASFEVIQEMKDKINPKNESIILTVGIWQTKVDLHVSNIIHSAVLHKLRDDILSAFQQSQKDLYNGNLTHDTKTASNLLLQFFAEEFTKNSIKSDTDYRISNFYINSLRKANRVVAPQFNNEKFDGINYPSVAMKYKGDNQAIFIESADDKLEAINAIQVICSNIDFENGDFIPKITHEAKSIIDGRIYWEDELYNE
ncbi:MAG: RES domain-containing protein [Ignavibacteria bacterium]|nr:RES domain-containing protein [Ignavibacteria bacterium]